MPRGAAAATTILLLLACGRADAQTTGRIVNPDFVEFDTPIDQESGQKGYVVELFAMGSDHSTDTPVKTVSPKPIKEDGIVRADLKATTEDLPDGEYVARLRAISVDCPVGVDCPVARSAPSQRFVLSRGTTLQQRADSAKREKFWTRFALGLAGAMMLVPLLL